MLKSLDPKNCTYDLSQESNYFQIHKNNNFSNSKPDWRHFRDFQPYVYVFVCALCVCMCGCMYVCMYVCGGDDDDDD